MNQLVRNAFSHVMKGHGLGTGRTSQSVFAPRFYSKGRHVSTKGINRKNKWANSPKRLGEKARKSLGLRDLFTEAINVVLKKNRFVKKDVVAVTSGDLARQIHAQAITTGLFKHIEEAEETKGSKRENRLRNALKEDQNMWKGLVIKVYMFWKEPAARNSATYDARSLLEENLVKKI